MEHPTPHPLLAAAEGTAAREAVRLLMTPAEKWTSEDLQFSEASILALTKHDYPLRLVAALHARHREAADLLLQGERVAAVPPAVLCADDRARKQGILRLVERIERDLRWANGGGR